MKEKIHPKWYPNAKVICACGNTFTTGSTKEILRTDICSVCHPFFTGEMRIVDTTGQVDRFIKRLERRSTLNTAPAAEPKESKKTKGKGQKKIVYELVDEEQAGTAEATSKTE